MARDAPVSWAGASFRGMTARWRGALAALLSGPSAHKTMMIFRPDPAALFVRGGC
jgi:hypothetical protein